MAVTVALRASVAATDTRSIAAGGFTRANRRPSVVVRTAPARPTSQHTVPAGDDPAVSTPASSGSVAAAKGAVAPAANSMDIPARRQRLVPSAATTSRSAARRLPATRAVSRKTRGAALADDSCRVAAGGAAAGGAGAGVAPPTVALVLAGASRAGCSAARPVASLAARSAAVGAGWAAATACSSWSAATGVEATRRCSDGRPGGCAAPPGAVPA